MTKQAKLRAKWTSIYHVDTHAHHLNLNSRPLCERLLDGMEAPRPSNRTDNPLNIRCVICIVGWDAICTLGLKAKWPVAMWNSEGGVVIPLPHWATIVHHRERILQHMGGLDTIMKSDAAADYKPKRRPA